jgi:hypothetical protein
VGSLVTAQQAIRVLRMITKAFLESVRDEKVAGSELNEATALLRELSYMRTAPLTKEYPSKLTKGGKRWRLLKESQDDPYHTGGGRAQQRSRDVENLDQACTSKMLYPSAYFDNQDIPFEMVKAVVALNNEEDA